MASKMAEMSEKYTAEELDRAIYRHQRRIKNTVIVFIISLIIVLILSAGISFGVNRVIDRLGSKPKAKVVAEPAGTVTNKEAPLVIGEPETESGADVVGDMSVDTGAESQEIENAEEVAAEGEASENEGTKVNG